MKICLDTNVVLDALLENRPPRAMKLWDMLRDLGTKPRMPAHAVTTIHYLLSKKHGKAKALDETKRLLQRVIVLPVSSKVVSAAAERGWEDFEDAVVLHAVIAARCDWLVTRDERFVRDCKDLLKPTVLSPDEAIFALQQRLWLRQV
ncbi:MAG: PIN domain-containing protein [Myxococcales bacterium]|nr:PIN domain-containing protein [Myxococcales bacterium]